MVAIKNTAAIKVTHWALSLIFFRAYSAALIMGHGCHRSLHTYPCRKICPAKVLAIFFGVMRIDAFRKADEFKEHMDKWITRFRSAATVAGQEKVIIPGDPEREMEVERMNNGIPLLPAVVADLKALSNKFKVDF